MQVVVNCNVTATCRYKKKSGDFHKFTDEEDIVYGFGFYKKEESIEESERYVAATCRRRCVRKHVPNARVTSLQVYGGGVEGDRRAAEGGASCRDACAARAAGAAEPARAGRACSRAVVYTWSCTTAVEGRRRGWCWWCSCITRTTRPRARRVGSQSCRRSSRRRRLLCRSPPASRFFCQLQ